MRKEMVEKATGMPLMLFDLGERVGNMKKGGDGKWHISASAKRKMTVRCRGPFETIHDAMCHGGLDGTCEQIEKICGPNLERAGQDVKDFYDSLRGYVEGREYIRSPGDRGSVFRKHAAPTSAVERRAFVEGRVLGS